jgi:hypothetical protein
MRDQVAEYSARRPSPVAIGAGALGVTALAALGAAWLLRAPLAGWALERYFTEREVAATFEIESVGFGGVSVRALDLGEGTQAEVAQALLRWRNGVPQVDAIVLQGVRAQGRWDENGLSFGALDRLAPAPSGERATIPAMGITIADAVISLETPFGVAQATLDAEGRLRGPLSGRLRLSLDRPEGEDFATFAALSGSGEALTLTFAPEAAGPALSGVIVAPWALTDIAADLTLSAATFEGFGLAAEGVSVQARFDGDAPLAGSDEAFGILEATASAQSLRFGAYLMTGAQLAVITPASFSASEAPFTLSADGFAAPGAQGGATAVRGVARWSGEGDFSASGDLTAAGISLDRGVRERVEGAWVNATGTPLEPVSAAGRRAVLGLLSGARASAGIEVSRTGEEMILRATGPLSWLGGNGVEAVFTPQEARLGFPSGDFSFSGEAMIVIF